jgi:hypothetical protein
MMVSGLYSMIVSGFYGMMHCLLEFVHSMIVSGFYSIIVSGFCQPLAYDHIFCLFEAYYHGCRRCCVVTNMSYFRQSSVTP